MNISLNWLAALVGSPLDPTEVAYRLTMLGASVDAVEPLHQDLGDIIEDLVLSESEEFKLLISECAQGISTAERSGRM